MLRLTATDLPRVMVCNGSRLMGEPEATSNSDTTVRDEGNAAHWLVEQVHSGKFAAEELVDRKAPNGVYITYDMLEYLEDYLRTVKQGGLVELDTSHNDQKWEIRGRADHVLFDEKTNTLHISDLKYGWSIVEPFMNWTLISHAMGWIKNNQASNRVENVVLTVYQPRPYHPVGRVRSWSFNVQTYLNLTNQIRAILSNPTDLLQTSEHCKNCPALASCPAALKTQYNAIEATECAYNDRIDNNELSGQLDHLKRAIEILKQRESAYQELALYRIKEGQIIQNYSVENELTNRVWQKHITPDLLKALTGKDLVKKPDIITPAQAEKQGVPKEIVAALTERRQKGFKLVRVDADAKAKKLFNPEN